MKKKLLKKPINSFKKLLRINKQNKQYKKFYINKQLRYLVLKLSILFESNLNVEIIHKMELEIINNTLTNETMYHQTIQTILKNSKIKNFSKLKYQNLSYFIFYIFQTSRFFYDKKHQIENIYLINYSEENLIKLNRIKRSYYYQFLEDIKKHNVNYNFYIIQILKWVK